MASFFTDKKSKVVVVDPSGPVRQMLADVVRTTLAFESVEAKASVQDALQFMEVDSCAWLFAPLMADQPVNGLHLLKICSETPELKHVRISLMLEEREQYIIPVAFEHGALSIHMKPFTKDSLGEELKRLAANFEANKNHEPLVATTYLGDYLKRNNMHDPQLKLIKGMLDLFPGEPNLIMALATPQFHLGKKDEAKRTLTQAKILSPQLTDAADGLCKQLFGEGEKLDADAAAGGINVLGLKSVVIVDSDDTVCSGMEDILKKLGVPEVKRFIEGESAWSYIDSAAEPDLIIMEWRIPKLSGPLLIQRIRAKNYTSVPIVILSSLLKADDMPLAREIGIATVINKPLLRELFLPALSYAVQQERMPSEHLTMERKIRLLLQGGKKEESDVLRAQFLANPGVPLAKKRLIEAEYAFACNNYTVARDAAIDALKLAGDSVITLNILGKSFMYLKNPEAALKCFKKAQELSPNNIERLCSIAETETELGNPLAAEDALDHAKALDPDNKTVAEAEAKVALAKGDTSAAKKVMSQLENLSGLVAYMNNKAVAHAKCGFAEDAIQLYRKTMDSIPDDKPEIRTIVQYNLALGLARAGELDAAVKELEEVTKAKNPKVGKKAHSLKERLNAALAKGGDFKLQATANGGDAAVGSTPAAAEGAGLGTAEEHRAMMSKIEAKRGDLCCFLVFTAPDPRDARADSLFAKPPRFQRRDAIAREESHGVERGMKESA